MKGDICVVINFLRQLLKGMFLITSAHVAVSYIGAYLLRIDRVILKVDF